MQESDNLLVCTLLIKKCLERECVYIGVYSAYQKMFIERVCVHWCVQYIPKNVYRECVYSR